MFLKYERKTGKVISITKYKKVIFEISQMCTAERKDMSGRVFYCKSKVHCARKSV